MNKHMIKTNSFHEMLDLQDRLNITTNGKDWKYGVTDEGRSIDWCRCIYMECIELIDSYPWKHWKDINGKIDKENAEIEVTDIWHFVMSYLISFDESHVTQDIVEARIDELKSRVEYIDCDIIVNENIDYINDIIEELMIATLLRRTPLEIALKFMTLLPVVGLTFDDMCKLYTGKNVLNSFRQKHGYKDGTYQKMWDGVEDNVILRKIIDSYNGKFLRYEIIYGDLERAYSKVLLNNTPDNNTCGSDGELC